MAHFQQQQPRHASYAGYPSGNGLVGGAGAVSRNQSGMESSQAPAMIGQQYQYQQVQQQHPMTAPYFQHNSDCNSGPPYSAHAQSQSQSQSQILPFPPSDYLPHYAYPPPSIPAQPYFQRHLPSSLPYYSQQQQHQQHHTALPSPAPAYAIPPAHSTDQYIHPQPSFAQPSIHPDAVAQTAYEPRPPHSPSAQQQMGQNYDYSLSGKGHSVQSFGQQGQIYNYHSGNDGSAAFQPSRIVQGGQNHSYTPVVCHGTATAPSHQLTPRVQHNSIPDSSPSATLTASGMQHRQQQPSFIYSQSGTHGHNSSSGSPSMQPSPRDHAPQQSSHATYSSVSAGREFLQPSTASCSSQSFPIPARSPPKAGAGAAAGSAPQHATSPPSMPAGVGIASTPPLSADPPPPLPYYITCSNAHCPSLSPPNYGAPVPSPAWATLIPCGCQLCRECIHLTLTASAVVSAGAGGGRKENIVPNTPLDLRDDQETGGAGKGRRSFACLSCGGWSAQFGPLNPTILAEDGAQGQSRASVGGKARIAAEAAGGTGAASLEKQEGDSRNQGQASTVLSPTLRTPMTAWSVPAANHGALNSIAEHVTTTAEEASRASPLVLSSPATYASQDPPLKSSNAANKTLLSPLADSKKSKESKSSPELSTTNFPSILYYSSIPDTAGSKQQQQQQRKSMPPPPPSSSSAQISDDRDNPPCGSSSVSESGHYSSILSFSSAIDLALPVLPPSDPSDGIPVFPYLPTSAASGALLTAISPIKQVQRSLPRVSIGGGGRQRQPSKALEIKDPKSGKRILDPIGGLTMVIGRRASSPAVVERDSIYTTVNPGAAGSSAASATATEANNGDEESGAEEKEALQVLDVLSRAESKGEDIPAGDRDAEDEEEISSYSEKEMEELLSVGSSGSGSGSGFPALRPLPGKKTSLKPREQERDSYIITMRAMELEERHNLTSPDAKAVSSVIESEGDGEEGGDTSADSDRSAMIDELEALREEEDLTPPPPSRTTLINNEHERTPTSSKNAKPYHYNQQSGQKRPVAPWPKSRSSSTRQSASSSSPTVVLNRGPPISPTLERVRQSSTSSLFSSSTSSSPSSPSAMMRGAFNSLSRRQRTATSSSAATAISGYSSNSTGTGAREELRNPALPKRFLDPITVLGVRAETSRRESWWMDPWTGETRKVAGDDAGSTAIVQQGVSWPILKLHNISFHTTIADLEAWVPAGILPPLSHNALSIHILCSVSSSSAHGGGGGSGMTLPYAYIECISEVAAQRLINERDEGWLAGRQVKFRAASQRALACDIFGHKFDTSSSSSMIAGAEEEAEGKGMDKYAIKKIAEEGGEPLMAILEESSRGKINGGQVGPVTLFSEKDKEDLEALFGGVSQGCVNSSSNIGIKEGGFSYSSSSPAIASGEIRFVRPEERPFARLASVITKFPWHVHRASQEEVDRLFSCLQVAVKTVYSMKDRMPFSRDICAMLVRAGLNCPGFDGNRKMQIKEAWSKIEEDLPNIKPEPFTPYIKASYPPPRYQQQRPFKTVNTDSSSNAFTISPSMDTPNLSISTSTSSEASTYSPITPLTPSVARQKQEKQSPPSGKFTFTAHSRVLDYSASPIPANLLTSEQRAFPGGRRPSYPVSTKYGEKQQSSPYAAPRHKRFTSGGNAGKPIGRPLKQGSQLPRYLPAGRRSSVMPGSSEIVE